MTIKIQVFGAEIERQAGKNRLKLNSPVYYQHCLNKFSHGEKVSIEVSNKKPQRSDQQNRYYWGVYLPLIAEETGETDIERMHEFFKRKFLLIKEWKSKDGTLYYQTKSTTDLSVGEFCDYIADIYVLTKVEPPPTENYGLPELNINHGN